ncbi:histidine protein methyltransferase 1 homolog [Maniola hyperantus]|uniref:histidine protein methyltransferase 1 homolog n=1 Tax=Aphantopus hyperantus TaxID=2795564 RepID=UPI0015687AEA|nr:histidine protein methyltransferase 1 homolog [Maniola hyperantus]
MASFKFNFSNTEEISETKDNTDITWLSSEEIVPSNQIKDLDDLVSRARMFTCGEVEIGHVLVNNIACSNETGLKNLIELSEKEHSDLVAGKYEGGLKIWECTYDLIEYFEKYPDVINFKDAKVLDLGCGAGILGMYAFLKKACFVTFQDYNKEILEYCTIPNVVLNIDEEEREKEIGRCKFYSGDWTSFDKLLDESEVFDIILTSETIYNQQNYDKLISLFYNRLSDKGTVFVGAKTYYFGVGGGTRQFEAALENTNLKSEVIMKTSSGIQREIIKINKS